MSYSVVQLCVVVGFNIGKCMQLNFLLPFLFFVFVTSLYNMHFVSGVTFEIN